MSAIDSNVQEYDDRVKMAARLAMSAEVGAACIGLLDWPRRRLVKSWVGYAESRADFGQADAANIVSKALTTYLSCNQADPSIATADRRRSQAREVETWLQSSRYLIGIGQRSGDYAPVTALVNDPSVAMPTGLLRLARVGLTYAEQICQAYLGPQLESRGSRHMGIPESILRSLSFGFVVTDAQGAVGYLTNLSRQWLEECQELCVAGDRLTARMPQNQKLLQAALAAATGDDARISVVQLDTSDDVPKTISVLPLGGSSGMALVAFRYARGDGALRDGLLETMGLTVAEQRLARQLLAGKSLAAAAKENNLTIGTARSYLKRIFAKTGIHRQSQLITLYHTLMPPLRVGSQIQPEEQRPH